MKPYQLNPAEREVLEASCIPMAVYRFADHRVVTLALSAGFRDLFGFDSLEEAFEVMDMDMYRDAHPDDSARLAEDALSFAKNEKPYDLFYRQRIRGEYRIIHAVGRHVCRDGIQLAFVTYMDEGAYKPESGFEDSGVLFNRSMSYALQNESGLLRSSFDYLTGLPSMTSFFEYAEAERLRMQERGESPAMLFIDLSGMNAFNRKYGFDGGNELLRAMAKLLSDTFGAHACSRFGQDHFTAVSAAAGLNNRLKKLFKECEKINGGRSLPLRVGIYLNELEEVSASTACDRAKVACNMTRKAYYSHYRYFSMTMLTDAERKQYIIDNLDMAIEEKWIQVYYQPIIRAANGRVCDEEALSRWIDPAKGLISPADFVPVLEDARLIYKLDLFVVEQVLEKMKAFREAGLYIVPQSVNLSRSDFDVCDIVSEIIRRTDDAGIPREKLTIELTESMVGSNYAFMKQQIERFRANGFHVWMDDFGSGYSSLDVLQTIPFDLIKLDMRFLEHFDEGDSSRVILSELVRMASGLGIDSVCEGVETSEQAEFLKEIGCTKLQGYYYCKPIPEDAIRRRYDSGVAIGFENPEESDYYSAIGRISLYDLSTLSDGDDENSLSYFDTVPMAILESDGKTIEITRCNRTYRLFMNRMFREDVMPTRHGYLLLRDDRKTTFWNAFMGCCEDGRRVMINEQIDETQSVHYLIQRIAVNPLAGVTACRVVILGTDRKAKTGLSYAAIAQSLSTNYSSLYDVDLKTEEFVEYRLSEADNLSIERHGTDFFQSFRDEAEKQLYPDDLDGFLLAFTGPAVRRQLETDGVFTAFYRTMKDKKSVHMNLKAVRSRNESDHMIVGVSNVDAEMKRKETLERLKEERTTFERIVALAGNFLCVYTVDPETEAFLEYSVSEEYETLGLPKSGSDFFRNAGRVGEMVLHPDDRMLFASAMNKERFMEEIREHGLVTLHYRVMIGGRSRYASLRAALVEEKDGPRLIVGISDIDAQTRRELELKHDLSLARS
ncbi:MAG: EAL domain-containing protein, partial [Clostridia bacterium]|nr:EAL domain-containing protein [Clostridia bacterium]